jgi:mono/diheme cytochrome c family protein
MKRVHHITIIMGIISLCAFTQGDPLQKSIEDGKKVYKEYCMLCHKADGNGKKDRIPPLANADYLKNRTATIKAIKFGLKGEIIVNDIKYDQKMSSQNLSDEEIANVTNYIFHTWGNDVGKIVTVNEVAKVK